YTELNPTNPTYKLTTGANRVDCARISALMGVLTKDYEQLLMAKDATESVLVYSTEGDGFYTDGSFIQHKDQYGLGATSYVGGYGNVFFAGVPTIASLLQGSPWEISSSKLQILKEFVDNALKPFIYNGIMLDMMRGRGISRSAEDAVGHTSLNAMMLIARIITDPVQKSEMYSFVKQMIQSDTSYDHMYNMRGVNLNQYPISLMNDLDRILNDPNIVPSAKQEYQKNLPMSDRAVHVGDNYLFGVAMFSTRITNFESMN
ncbi:silent information regulator protein Sir2, partial [Clostridium perfringens]|nr:silent information regulator protein Sir2 [Clostridium perfringens]